MKHEFGKSNTKACKLMASQNCLTSVPTKLACLSDSASEGSKNPTLT